MKTRNILLVLVLLLIPALLGCPGNRPEDQEVKDKLWAWIQEQDQNNWDIPGFDQAIVNNIVIDHNFRPTVLELAIDEEKVNNMHERNMLDNIALKWRSFYPASRYPHFELTVHFYNMEIGSKDLGYSTIDKDGRVETHHISTHDRN